MLLGQKLIKAYAVLYLQNFGLILILLGLLLGCLLSLNPGQNPLTILKSASHRILNFVLESAAAINALP